MRGLHLKTDKWLKDAENLLIRGQKVLRRQGWEKGETDREWSLAVASFLGQLKVERQYPDRREVTRRSAKEVA